ncbi:PAAR domain-containing protein [Trinickia sp. LjRoot230]|uniref:PAAR domain-containing protein n=1 Tax=Trinickia sp. LjRoot230 TaxID=3342288 RepID=UPI003ED02A0B
MTKRYDIFKGDYTTAGGKVEGGATNDKSNGREQAYENDQVWCPICKTMGKIGCAGTRLTTKGPDGREAALSGDLCICHCHPSPRLVPSQYASYVDV